MSDAPAKHIVCLNGEFMPAAEAKVSIFDRGLTFADSIYEVCPVAAGRLINWQLNQARAKRSLREIDIRVADNFWTGLEQQVVEMVKRNELTEGYIYIQVTRGVAPRAFAYPDTITPTVIMSINRLPIIKRGDAYKDIAVWTMQDLRWGRCDIKSTQLLYPIMAVMNSQAKGGQEALFVSDGMVTECSAANAYIIQSEGVVVTRPLSHEILPGCTREALLSLCRARGWKVDERPFSLEEAFAAEEAFITSAIHFVTPVTSIDGRKIGNGRIGQRTAELHEAFLKSIGF